MPLSMEVLQDYLAQAHKGAETQPTNTLHRGRISTSATIELLVLDDNDDGTIAEATLSALSCHALEIRSRRKFEPREEFFLRVEQKSDGARWIRCAVIESRIAGGNSIVSCRFCDVQCTSTGAQPLLINSKSPPKFPKARQISRLLADVDERRDAETAAARLPDQGQRPAPRSKLPLQMEAILPDSPIKDRRISVKVKDISITGIGFTCRNFLAVGTHISFTFGIRPAKTLVAKVMRCVPLYPDGHLVGARILERVVKAEAATSPPVARQVATQ